MKGKNNKGKVVKGSSKVGQIRMVSDSNQNVKLSAANSKEVSKKAGKTRSKASLASKTSKQSMLSENSIRPAISLNFDEESKIIPKSLLCNICKNLVRNPTKCYQCKALFCRECFLQNLEKKHKCPKCFKIISENLIKNSTTENEFKNIFIKCRYNGCKESINLLDYEEHLKVCPFQNLKNFADMENLLYSSSSQTEQDPCSNNAVMDYCLNNVKKEIRMNNETSYANDDEVIENEYNNLIEGKGGEESMEIFKNIIQNGKEIENVIDDLENRKKEVNSIIKEYQNKINLHEII